MPIFQIVIILNVASLQSIKIHAILREDVGFFCLPQFRKIVERDFHNRKVFSCKPAYGPIRADHEPFRTKSIQHNIQVRLKIFLFPIVLNYHFQLFLLGRNLFVGKTNQPKTPGRIFFQLLFKHLLFFNRKPGLF